jgi:ADP-ribose pyrophosphatase
MDIDPDSRNFSFGSGLDMTEETISEETVFRGKVFDVEIQQVRLMDGTHSVRELVHHSGGACVVPVDENGNVYLIRQYRKSFESETLEIPSGKLEPDEDPFHCAVRELKEETGLEADRIESLGEIYPTPGYCDEVIHIYLATGLKSGKQNLDPGEFLRVLRMPIEHVLAAIFDDRIKDAKTVVGLLKAKELLKVE